MISIVGRPLYPLTSENIRTLPTETFTFTLRHWNSPYSSKHALASLDFDITNKTFRLGTAARVLWFVVMHPIDISAAPLSRSLRDHRASQHDSIQHSALDRPRAKLLVKYIKNIFTHGDLLGEGVEASWSLNDQRSQTIAFSKWAIFQQYFMREWHTFAENSSEDSFWVKHQPVFHAYDHGANTDIDPHPSIRDLSLETRIRAADEHNEDSNHGQTTQAPTTFPPSEPNLQQAMRDSGIEPLYRSFQNQFDLKNVDKLSYALAANINCTEPIPSPPDPDHSQSPSVDPQPVCLLANRTSLHRQYDKPSNFTFYPLALHPGYGNFSSPKPPLFLKSLLAVMKENMSIQNDGSNPLHFGYFQGYTNVKRVIRSRPEDLLATKGIATAALCLPMAEANRSAPVKNKQQKLLNQLQGQNSPDNPSASTPFAREQQQIRHSIDAEEYAFRMEQVVTINILELCREHRHFEYVFIPIFQLIRFFYKEKLSYHTILHAFEPEVFPGILISFARIFELALGEMQSRFISEKPHRLSLPLSEGTAIIDRLGHYCFTGDSRVLPNRVLRPLRTLERLTTGGWPYIDPDVLDLRPPRGTIQLAAWPRTGSNQQLQLIHISALEYHYGRPIGAGRLADHHFSTQGGGSIQGPSQAARFTEDLFCQLMVPQTQSFVAKQLRRRPGSSLGLTVEARQQIRDALKTWENLECPLPFRWL